MAKQIKGKMSHLLGSHVWPIIGQDIA